VVVAVFAGVAAVKKPEVSARGSTATATTVDMEMLETSESRRGRHKCGGFCKDKLKAAAVVVTLLMPVLGICVIFSAGCSVTKRVANLVFMLVCAVCGLFSIGLWTAILLRHLWNRGSGPKNTDPSKPKKGPPLLLAFALSSLVTGLGYAHAHLGDYGYLQEEYDENWGYLVRENIAPVWVGEFGADEGGETDTWFLHLLRYTEELELGWSYWPLDGAKEDINNEETYGILQMDYLRYRDPGKLQLLAPKLNLTAQVNGDVYPPGFAPGEPWGDEVREDNDDSNLSIEFV